MPNNPKILIATDESRCANYISAVEQANYSWLCPSAHTKTGFLPLHKLNRLSFDFLLLPGGGDVSPLLYGQKNTGSKPPDYVTDLIQFQLLQLAHRQRKPILGICKGMQMINIYFGGDLHQHLPTSDVHSYQKGDQMHPVLFADGFPEQTGLFHKHSSFSTELYRILEPYREVNSAHHQGIRHLGEGLRTIQHSSDYLPETIGHSSLPILGLQWHPERLVNFKEKSFCRIIELLLQSASM